MKRECKILIHHNKLLNLSIVLADVTWRIWYRVFGGCHGGAMVRVCLVLRGFSLRYFSGFSECDFLNCQLH